VAEIDAGHSTQMVSELEIEHSYSSFGATLERKDISVVSWAATADEFHASAVRGAAGGN